MPGGRTFEAEGAASDSLEQVSKKEISDGVREATEKGSN